MYKITWDAETGGVLLGSKVTSDSLGVSPRPVFYEELDLLGLDQFGWKYPRCHEPLLWACNKQYFYRGELVFEAKGANVYDKATVILQPDAEGLELVPVDMPEMLERNKELMFLIESEAIEYIRNIYLQYAGARKSVDKVAANQLDFETLAANAAKRMKRPMTIVRQDCDSFDMMPLDNAKEEGKRTYFTTRIDKFLASFSGGKDSQVVLDLCTRAIPSSEFEVIYSDTGYELPTSFELYEQVQKHYKALYPDLKFSIARNHQSVLHYWDQIGTPSDAHRWCCSVMKTAPLYRLLKIEGTNKQAKVLAFQGMRTAESAKRSEYQREGRGKHNNVFNALPILQWNAVEVFLYLFKYNLPINRAYRQGKSRVGCIICPYSSAWDDMISNTCYKKEFTPFLTRIENGAKEGGIKDVDDYIKERKWKFRASGNYIKEHKTTIAFSGVTPNFVAKVQNPKTSIEQWLPILGDYSLQRNGSQVKGELKFQKAVYQFLIEEKPNQGGFVFSLFNVDNAQLIKYLKRILYKTTYCIHCETCEVECPTGALSILPGVQVDKSKCIHCFKCLDFHDHGCIVANSLILTTDTKMKAKSGIDRYNTFGLKEEWVDLYFSNFDNYWNEGNGLGTKQIPAMKNWLKDAEIIDAKSNITDLGKTLAKIYMDMPYLVWEIIWINLVYNSFIAQWYAARIKNNIPFTKALMKEMIQEEFPNVYSDRTVKNAIDAIIRTLKESPIGNIFNLYEGQEKDFAIRLPYNDLSEEAVAYSLYKYSKVRNTLILRVSDFYQNDSEAGVFVEFGIAKSDLEKKLRALNSLTNRVLVAELNMGLDYITLREDLDALKVLEILTK